MPRPASVTSALVPTTSGRCAPRELIRRSISCGIRSSRTALFKDGDLPPVLDIEPSKSQVEQMGADRMFQQIRIWLRAVERSTGVKPILYVNQMFVNNYLSKQPDLKRDYRVWIARYSEYKPDVRLAFWQLCPDGRVAGIQGDVDINVFNGYKSQFEEFIETETIKRN